MNIRCGWLTLSSFKHKWHFNGCWWPQLWPSSHFDWLKLPFRKYLRKQIMPFSEYGSTILYSKIRTHTHTHRSIEHDDAVNRSTKHSYDKLQWSFTHTQSKKKCRWYEMELYRGRACLIYVRLWCLYNVLFMMMIFMVNSILVTNADSECVCVCATKRGFGFWTKFII